MENKDLPDQIDATPKADSEGYDIEFLKGKGYFDQINEQEDTVEDIDIDYVFDVENRVAYFEGVPIELVSDIVKELRTRRNFDFYWFWEPENERVEVLRTFGENKQFIYNPDRHVRDTARSKQSKLENISSDGLASIFDVKDIVNQFYRDLWTHRLKLAKSIDAPEAELSDQDRLLAAQRIIDRLMFTYFLAEKEIIIGVAPNGNISRVNAKKLFQRLVGQSNDFSNLLKTVFYQRFNSQKKNDYTVSDSGFSIYLPYLNGGLFRPQMIEDGSENTVSEEDIVIEGFDWSDLIDELNKYNWILEDFEVESRSGDERIRGNLTPEILGYIYEKFVITVSEFEEEDVDLEELEIKGDSAELQTGNREIGAYYTPEDVVDYIGDYTLWEQLSSEVDSIQEYESFDEFYSDNKENEEILDEVKQELVDLRIVDPGVGSGHFLLSLANKIEDWITKCSDEVDIYDMRKQIVLNNLYGVDILEGATDICQLRLWLWLIAAQDVSDTLQEASSLKELEENVTIEPLPNIDYNIRTGNSLVGFHSNEVTVDGTMILVTQDIEEQISEYSQKVESIKDRHTDVEKLRTEIENLHQGVEDEINGKYTQYLNSYSEVSGDRRKLHFEDGEDFLEKVGRVSGDPYVRIRSKKEIGDKLNSLFDSDYSKTAKGEVDESDIEQLAELLKEHGEENLKESYIETEFSDEELDEDAEYSPVHWILEFPEVFNGDNPGFDIVIGNPPYGDDVLDENEKEFLRQYDTDGGGDIAGYFLEREVHLLKEGGTVGNVIAASLVVNKRMTSVRDFLRNNIDGAKLSFFGIRPAKIFDSVDERVSFVLGQKETEDPDGLYTSRNYRFTQEQRKSLFEDLQYAYADEYLLGKMIGTRTEKGKEQTPKIGRKESKHVLQKLKQRSESNGVIKDILQEEGFKLDFRSTARYWLNALREFPYDSTKIDALYFDSQRDRDLVEILFNSSLFYLYWSIYGNNRDVQKSMIKKFPLPTQAKMDEYSSAITELANELDEDLNECFNPDAGTVGEFNTEEVKDTIDKADQLLGEIYEFSDEEVEYITSYDSHLRGG